MKAAIYARYSSEGQRATSIEDQERNCRRRADSEGWTVAHVYADAAMSGAKADRPQYQAMLAAALAGEFGILIVDDLSRFARDSVEQESTIRRLEFQGLRIVAVSDGYDSATSSSVRKVHRGVKGLMNELFLEDLAAKVHRGQTGQALKGRWNGGRPYGYRLVPVRDPLQRDPYGEPLRIGTTLEVDAEQAEIVREIFQRSADGAGCLSIAAELNARGVPSPGSTWRRKVRRCSGWTASGVRVILRNELYRGRLTWNKAKFVRHPDTRKELRRERPTDEWIVSEQPSLRIVSDELFALAGRRGEPVKADDSRRAGQGRRPKYPLSGLLICQKCKAHYVMANERNYACGSFAHGRACSNGILIRRTVAEERILGPIRDELLSPSSVEAMASDLHRAYAASAAARQQRAAEQPKELAELEARIDRLRARLSVGDPDMTADELQAAIQRAEEKREALLKAPETRGSAKILTMLPKAAAEMRREVEQLLQGRSSDRARMALRRLIGRIELEPDADGGLWANMEFRPQALLLAGGNNGRGERI